MKTENNDSWIKFVLYVTVVHCITYTAFGMVASPLFDYSRIFEMPIISDYYKPFGSTAIFLGPFIQVIRGLLFGFVLLPFRRFLKEETLGWLWLWLVFIVFGILGTPAAAPSSIEGLIYTKIPVWFHLIGMPEMLGQTLLFSFITHRYLQNKDDHSKKSTGIYSRSIMLTCISFFGYSIISVIFAVLSGIKVETNAANVMVLGQFILPVVMLFVFSLIRNGNAIVRTAILYILSASSIWLYQEYVLGAGGLLYSLVAPILPILLLYISGKMLKNATT